MKMKPIASIKADLGIEPNGRVQKYFVERCAIRMEKYIPYSGDGNNVAHLRELKRLTPHSIIYFAPYAHAQYVGFTKGIVRHYTTPRNGIILGQKNENSRNARLNLGGARICKTRLKILEYQN